MNQTIEQIMEEMGVNETVARFILALEKGEITGDVITGGRQDSRSENKAADTDTAEVV